MKTKIKENIFIEKNWKYFEIPEKILQEINEKWFFLYEWIDEKEVKKTIEIDFLEKLIFFWPIWFFIMLFLAFVLNIYTSIIFLAIFTILVIFYLLFLSISRAFLASKINFLILTTKYFSINRKIWEIKENKIFLENELLEKSKIFEENLFDISNLEKKKKEIKDKYTFWILNKLKNKEKDWIYWEKNKGIFSNFDLDDLYILKNIKFSKDNQNIILIILWLLIIFVFTMSILYIFWIALVLIIWLLTSAINKKILILKWDKVLKINKHFENIENLSKNIKNEKNNLEILLKEAINNEWKDWLLLKINSWIENINKNTEKSINENLKFFDILKNSEFDEIFDYNIYNSWLKKQIKEPIKWIISLLEKNVEIINNEINSNFWNETVSDEKLKNHLEIAKNRLFMKKESLEKNIISMKWYLTKLELN